MSSLCMSVPVFLIICLGGIGIAPKTTVPKFVLDVSTIGVGLFLGLPISVAIFPAMTIKKGADLEPEFHKHD